MACDAVLREVLRLRLPRLLLPKRIQLLHLQAQLQTAKGTLACWDLSCKALASQVQQVNSSTFVSGLQQLVYNILLASAYVYYYGSHLGSNILKNHYIFGSPLTVRHRNYCNAPVRGSRTGFSRGYVLMDQCHAVKMSAALLLLYDQHKLSEGICFCQNRKLIPCFSACSSSVLPKEFLHIFEGMIGRQCCGLSGQCLKYFSTSRRRHCTMSTHFHL